ncbi:MAG: HAD family hydrolase [Candidatus Odinarchaeota archaeon]|nr:HAD family hydrolase [Candidatus Odinarchaeota archaeon]
MDLPKAIIIDLDGTIANNEKRLLMSIKDVIGHEISLIRRSYDIIKEVSDNPRIRSKIYDIFLSPKYVPMDEPIPNSKEVINRIHKDMGLKVIYVTGRPEKMRRITIKWLKLHGYPIGELYMKKRKYEKEFDFKKRVFSELKMEFDIVAVIGDTSNDVAAAKANRIISIAITTNFSRNELDSADFIVDDWLEIEDIIKNLLKCA